MAISIALAILTMSLLPLATPKDIPPPKDQTLNIAIQEMQRANYFAFVMLLNMAPPEKLPNNITFLMPNNRNLAKATIPENDILGFLLRHSIPTPLRFDYLRRFPSGSIIPTSEPKFMLNISNNGRKSFFLNNVKLVSPDICVAGSSIRCHGIDGVLLESNTAPPPLFTPPTPIVTAPPPALPPPPGGGSGLDTALAPAAFPQPDAQQPTGSEPGPRNSGSSLWASGRGLIKYLSNWVMLLIFWCCL